MQPLVSAMTAFRKAFLNAIVKSLLRGKSLIQAILAYWVSPLAPKTASNGKLAAASRKTLEEFLKDAEAALLGPFKGEGLSTLADNLKVQFVQGMQSDLPCMLPSYSHLLPKGDEAGQYLALDVGGSTLRVALVELRGRAAEEGKQSEIISMRNFKISRDIKDYEGMVFFDWMAARIIETLKESNNHEHSIEKPLPVALAWSFPLE